MSSAIRVGIVAKSMFGCGVAAAGARRGAAAGGGCLRWPALAAGALLAAAGAAVGVAGGPVPGEVLRPPTFALRISVAGQPQPLLRVYAPPAPGAGGVFHYADEFISADHTSVGPNLWQLVLTNISGQPAATITDVYCPYDAAAVTLGASGGDDVLYLPWIFGMAMRADLAPSIGGDWWQVSSYPGGHVSPLVILGDGHAARLYAAANWPPLRVTPSVLPKRAALIYAEQALGPQRSRTYRSLVLTAAGDAATGNPPWMNAVDRYKSWLLPHLVAEGLSPVVYPEWMQYAHGYFGFGLMDIADGYWGGVEQIWDIYKDKLPLALFWGQMSCYHGPEPWPPCYGCCLLEPTLHARYQVPGYDIPAFCGEVTADGKHAGFYSRPYWGYELDQTLPLPGDPTNLQWWTAWLDNQDSWGATAYYLDTVGWVWYGDGLAMARLLRDEPRFRNALIEGAADLYPAANMVSLCLHYPGAGFPGGPGHTIDDLSNAVPAVTFPQLGTYLLNDRVIFNGFANTGWQLWGAANQYWTERQVFLLGHKYDAWLPFESWADPGVINAAFGQAVSERDEVYWWQRGARYQDRRGITGVPAGVDVRRFDDANGESLLVIDNWNQAAGLSFRFLGQLVAIPSDALSIVPAGGPQRGDANCDGVVDFFDIDAFLLALFDPATYVQVHCGGSILSTDVDCSGAVDFFDIDPFLDCLFGMCGPC